MKERKILKILLLCLAPILLSVKSDGVIENEYSFLIGEYTYFQSVDGKKTTKVDQNSINYKVKITAKDELLITNKKKKLFKYKFSNGRLPLQNENYVLIGKDGEYEPVFYSGDSIILQSFPNPYEENYFIKKGKKKSN